MNKTDNATAAPGNENGNGNTNGNGTKTVHGSMGLEGQRAKATAAGYLKRFGAGDGAANTGRVHEVMLALTRLPAHQRRVLSAKLREVQEDTSIDQDQKAKIVSDLLNKWLKGVELRAEARFASEEISDDEEVEMPATSEEQVSVLLNWWIDTMRRRSLREECMRRCCLLG